MREGRRARGAGGAMDEVIVGSYEGFLLGYSMSNDVESNKLKQTFATHSHTSSVRCLDISGRFLASGGTDDKVVVIDLKTRKEHTVLMHHDGTVNALAFTSRGTHLVTGSSDGSIVVIRVGNFQIEKKWKKAHGGSPVNAIAVHPSDKLALSIGGDKSLRTWNLVKGRPAFTINLSSKGVNLPTDLAWSPGGDRFSLISQQTVDIWTISKAGIEKRITCNSKPTSVAWISDEKLAVGLENGNILTMTVTDTQALTCHAHKQRVKCLFYTSGSLYSASSSGEIKLWCLSDNNCLTERCIANSGCRVTCISVNHQSKFIKKEEASDEEKDQEESKEDEVNEHEEREVEEVDVKPSEVENKNRSYVSIQYEDEEQDEPASKKLKKKKKPKNNFKKKRD